MNTRILSRSSSGVACFIKLPVKLHTQNWWRTPPVMAASIFFSFFFFHCMSAKKSGSCLNFGAGTCYATVHKSMQTIFESLAFLTLLLQHILRSN